MLKRLKIKVYNYFDISYIFVRSFEKAKKVDVKCKLVLIFIVM